MVAAQNVRTSAMNESPIETILLFEPVAARLVMNRMSVGRNRELSGSGCCRDRTFQGVNAHLPGGFDVGVAGDFVEAEHGEPGDGCRGDLFETGSHLRAAQNDGLTPE